MIRRLSLLTIAAAALLTTGCIRDYNAPKFADIAPNETAYVVPLNGDTGDQAKFNSVEFLDQHKVAAKRIQIPRVWIDDGYLHNSGYYQDAVRVITVDRTPVTVEFVQDSTQVDSSGHIKRSDMAIWAESKDSIGFSMGFSATLLIAEVDTSTYLYRYPGVSLAHEAASEFKTRVQSVVAAFSAQYTLDDLRSHKNEMMKAIRDDVIPYFMQRGITVSTIAQQSGMVYEDKEIQTAINSTFIAEQQKVVAAALLTAQKDINDKSSQTAMQEKLNAVTKATGEAQAITLVATAAKEAASNPAFLRLRELEVEQARIARWDGVQPKTLITSGAGTSSGGLNLFVEPSK